MLLLALCLAAAKINTQDPAPVGRVAPPLQARVGPGPYLVGQAVEIEVEGGGGGPVEPPRVEGADLLPVDRGPDAAAVERFVLIPRRAGALTVPPFRSRGDGRPVASRAARLAVAAVPTVGRPRHFLGGVGEFRVSSRIEPATVRAGQVAEFRIEVAGPAASGSSTIPDLAGWSDLPGGIQVRAATTEVDRGNPPARTFRFRLRPTRAGRLTLPPVPVAAYDPASRRYLTRYTPSVELDVAAPPPIDPGRVDFGPNIPARAGYGLRLGVALAGCVGVGLGWLGAGRLLRHQRGARTISWRREAARLRRSAGGRVEAVEVAGLVADRFARAVAAATRRPWAVPTPAEAEAAVAAIAGDGELAGRAGRLVAELDRARFDPEASAAPGDPERWVAEAAGLFEAIDRKSRRPGWFGSGRPLVRGPRWPDQVSAGRRR